ncbi:MAG: GT4 family glycosyltransferase PelF, partial [Candidatus Omnitrophica bacterium]|nr:GT4 family glycosyltransferase PelF [Candidatus Omnitrophota bacterium]
MNILQILPELHVGGVETGTLDLARWLVKMGHKAVVVSAGGALVEELESCGAVHYRLPVHKKSFFTMLRMIPKLTALIRKEKIDIVHARSRVPAWIAYFACRRTQAVFVTTCHGYYGSHFFTRPMGWGKRVIVLSTVIARHMIEDFGVPRERIVVVPRSVDLERFRFRAPEKKRRKQELNVGIVGRITPIKGHRVFIEAMAKLARGQENLKIWIVGDAPASKTPYKEELQSLVRRLGLSGNTQFLGNQRDIPQILKHMDVLVLATTTHEAFGRVIVEAQACGVPVVATRVGGVIDVVEHEKTGLLVPPSDPAAMAEAVGRIARSRKLARTLAHAAYEKVCRQYSVEHMVRQTLEVYRDALTSRKILVIKMSALGDIILATASLRALREHFPSRVHISCLVAAEYKDVLLRCPYIDELIVTDARGRDAGFQGTLRVGRRLRSKGFDAVVDLQNNRLSHVLGFLSGASRRYGYRNRKLGFFINRNVTDIEQKCSAVEHQYRILRLFGVTPAQRLRLALWPSDQDRATAGEFLNTHWLGRRERIVGINFSASSRWTTKCLPFESMVALCEELGARDMRPLITGTRSDDSRARALAGRVKNTRVINACGKTTVNQLACLIEKCDVFVTGDSAPLHVAAAMNTPVVAL